MAGTAIKIFVIAFALSSTIAMAKGKSEYAGKTCTNNGDSRFCMVCNNYFEARGEPYSGKVAVGRVVLTRKGMKGYPKSICGVIYQRKQFSWTLKGGRRLPTSGTSYRALLDSIKAADEATRLGPSGNTHFHATYVKPRWRKQCAGKGQIGEHLFYRCVAHIDTWVANDIKTYSALVLGPYDTDVATSGGFYEDDPDAFIDDRGLMQEREDNAKGN